MYINHVEETLTIWSSDGSLVTTTYEHKVPKKDTDDCSSVETSSVAEETQQKVHSEENKLEKVLTSRPLNGKSKWTVLDLKQIAANFGIKLKAKKKGDMYNEISSYIKLLE